MERIIKNICKKALVFTMCVITFGSAIFSSLTYASASKLYNQLGTNTALGSPILNNNFTTEQWNKWEIEVWGIFLSNFCVPLIDDYKTAFTVQSEGSCGAGYKALQFGTGSDKSNGELIENLCNYAVRVQETSNTKIYVSYSYLQNNEILVAGNTPEAIQGENKLREATFQDLFMDTGETSSAIVSGDVSDVKSLYRDSMRFDVVTTLNYFGDAEYNIITYSGAFPTFWVKTNDGTYEKILDYTDPWDIQIGTLIVSKGASSDRAKEFHDTFDRLYKNNAPLRFDAFGNIITEGNKIVIPGAANKNLTVNGDINLLNSFVLNGLSETLKTEDLLYGLSQYETVALIGADPYMGGVPALSGKRTKIPEGSTYIYYDFDNEAVMSGVNGNFGKSLDNFLSRASLTNKTNPYNLKIEAVNILRNNIFNNVVSDGEWFSDVIAKNQLAASLISTYITPQVTPNVLTDITYLDGSKYPLFDSDPILVNVQMATSEDEESKATLVRRIYNFFYQCYLGKINETSYGNLSRSEISSALKGGSIVTGKDFKTYVLDGLNIEKVFNKLYSTDYKNSKLDWNKNNSINEKNLRTIVLYPTSSILKTVGNILNVEKDEDFALYCPYIYVTYLEFFGIVHSSDVLGNTNQTSQLKENLFNISFDPEDFDPGEHAGTPSKEELKGKVLDYSYLMLSPTEGRAYRTELVTTGISDWIYETYTRIVYGSSTKDGSAISTKSNSGFLHVFTYSENPLTSPFVEAYTDVALLFIVGLIVLMIILGLLRGKPFSWYIITAVVIINTVLLVPSTGELIPYFTSNLVQNLFTDKMTYWSISEAVSNSSLENDAVSQSGGLAGLSEEDAMQVVKLVKGLNINYLDRSLTVKRDISAKVTQKLGGGYTEIQSTPSARWLLPTVMRQYSQDNGGSDYVYLPLADLFDDMSNMYWYFNPVDTNLLTKKTSTSTQNGTAAKVEDLSAYYVNATGYYPDFNTLNSSSSVVTDIALTEYDDTDSNKIRDISYQASCYDDLRDPYKYIHTYSYIMQDVTIQGRGNIADYGNEFDDITEIYETYLLNAVTASGRTKFENKLNNIESVADQYTRTDRSSIYEDFAYLWATESPAHYFYQLLKDTFSAEGLNLGKLIGQLQGQIGVDAEGKDVRDSFMHATEKLSTGEEVSTGYTRDILDLQCLFANMVPYLYQVQISAGGLDAESGCLVDAEGKPLLIDELDLYEGQNANWLFRSNWALKIMESPEYNKPMKIKGYEGDKKVTYTISNPILAECYPENRPMIYSEAQMHSYGLTEDDLNVVELKCIKANKDTCNKWTMLINYAGTSNITPEVLIRQMALDATLTFNETFSPSGIFNSAFAMYPQTVDLRNISFDSVMKMVMLNVSKDTSYIYGNTMATLVDTTDIFTASLLLIVAMLCAYVIPFIRMVLMALIFYLGFMAAVRAVVANNKYKAKVACGQFISNLIFLAITFAFYFIFYLLINITSSEDILFMSRAQLTPGNPVWSLIIVLLACIGYIVAMTKMVNFCWKNYRDMGAEMYGMMMHAATEKVKSGIGGIRADLGKKADADAAAARANAKTGTKAGNANGQDIDTNGNITVNSSNEESKGNKSTNKKAKSGKKTRESTYNDKAANIKSADIELADDIDSKIKKGAAK